MPQHPRPAGALRPSSDPGPAGPAMSDTTSARTLTAPATVRVARRHRPVLRRVRRIGFLLLGLKLAGFAWWSTLLYQHFALTPDFAQYHQAWYLIAHGHLNPYDTVGNFTFWQNHAEFIMWPLALLYWIFPSGLQLLWLQDIGVVGAELVAFLWLCQLAERYRPGRDAQLAGRRRARSCSWSTRGPGGRSPSTSTPNAWPSCSSRCWPGTCGTTAAGRGSGCCPCWLAATWPAPTSSDSAWAS